MYSRIAIYEILSRLLLVWGSLRLAQMIVNNPYSIFDMVALMVVLGTIMGTAYDGLTISLTTLVPCEVYVSKLH